MRNKLEHACVSFCREMCYQPEKEYNMSNAQKSRGQRSRKCYHIPSILCLMLFTTLLILASCGSQNSTGSQSSSSQVQGGKGPGANVLVGALSEPHMINAMVGWAVNWDIAKGNSYDILRTSD